MNVLVVNGYMALVSHFGFFFIHHKTYFSYIFGFSYISSYSNYILITRMAVFI